MASINTAVKAKGMIYNTEEIRTKSSTDDRISMTDRLETVTLDSFLRNTSLHKKVVDLRALVALELNNFPEFVVFNNCAVACEFLYDLTT